MENLESIRNCRLTTTISRSRRGSLFGAADEKRVASYRLELQILEFERSVSLSIEAIEATGQDLRVFRLAGSLAGLRQVVLGRALKERRSICVELVDCFEEFAWQRDGCFDSRTTNIPPIAVLAAKGLEDLAGLSFCRC